MNPDYQPTLTFARNRDNSDPLGGYQSKFFLPTGLAQAGKAVTYLASHQLGLSPRSATDQLEDELDRWGRFAAGGFTLGSSSWDTYAPQAEGPLAKLLGAEASSVVLSGAGPTAQLSQLLLALYRPSGERRVILTAGQLTEGQHQAFEQVAALTQHSKQDIVVELQPEDGRFCLKSEQITESIGELSAELAIVFLPAVDPLTGQYFDLEAIGKAAKQVGALLVLDLTQAIGNVVMLLDEWEVDAAFWSSHAYLCSGPYAGGGLYIHPHHADVLASTRKATTPPAILDLACLRSTLSLFNDVGMRPLRERSIALTGYLEFFINRADPDAEFIELVTPSNFKERGNQLTIALHGEYAVAIAKSLQTATVVGEFKPAAVEDGPAFLLVSVCPFYTTYIDLLRAGETLRVVLEGVRKRVA